MGHLTIIRGLPGGGKSRLGHRLAEESGALFLEPDQLLTCSGRYCYTPAEFGRATAIALDIARRVASLGCDLVYADVLPRRADVARVAKACGVAPEDAFVVVCTVWPEESIARNRHSVDLRDILLMAAAWQEWPGQIDAREEGLP